MKYLASLFALLLTACSVMPIDELNRLTPDECYSYGVNVAPDAEIVGTVVSSNYGFYWDTERECGGEHGRDSGFKYVGCSLAVEGLHVWPSPSHQYHIWYAEHKCAPQHEACHSIYEEWHHTTEMFIAQAQDVPLAYCPPSDYAIWKHNFLEKL